MGCCLSSHRRHRSEADDSTTDYPPDDDDHLPDNRPPPNLALMSSVHTLRSHLAMSPPSTPFNPRRPSPEEEEEEEDVRILRHHHDEEILYPIRFTQKHVSSSSHSRHGRRYGAVGNNQIAALDHDVDRVFDDLSTTTTAINFSKEVQTGGERTPSSRVGSGQWSIGSPTPVPLAEIWKRQNHRPPPPPQLQSDSWSSTAPARALSRREVMSRRERERERGIRWDPPPAGSDFSDTSSASTDSTTSRERPQRSNSVRVNNNNSYNNKKAPRKVTFGELPRRKGSDLEDGRAARRVARSRVGSGWSSAEVSESFEGWSLGMCSGGSGRKQWQMGGTTSSGRGRGREDGDVLIRQRVGSEYEPTNDLLSMEGFVFF